MFSKNSHFFPAHVSACLLMTIFSFSVDQASITAHERPCCQDLPLPPPPHRRFVGGGSNTWGIVCFGMKRPP